MQDLRIEPIYNGTYGAAHTLPEVHSTHYRDKMCTQKEGFRMGSPLPTIVVNVDIFGNTEITIFAYPPKIWRRYVELSRNIARSFPVQIAEIK